MLAPFHLQIVLVTVLSVPVFVLILLKKQTQNTVLGHPYLPLSVFMLSASPHEPIHDHFHEPNYGAEGEIL